MTTPQQPQRTSSTSSSTLAAPPTSSSLTHARTDSTEFKQEDRVERSRSPQEFKAQESSKKNIVGNNLQAQQQQQSQPQTTTQKQATDTRTTNQSSTNNTATVQQSPQSSVPSSTSLTGTTREDPGIRHAVLIAEKVGEKVRGDVAQAQKEKAKAEEEEIKAPAEKQSSTSKETKRDGEQTRPRPSSITSSETSSDNISRFDNPSPDMIETIQTPASSPIDLRSSSNGSDERKEPSLDTVEENGDAEGTNQSTPAQVYRNFAAHVAATPYPAHHEVADLHEETVRTHLQQAEAEALVGRAALEGKPLPTHIVEAVQKPPETVLNEKKLDEKLADLEINKKSIAEELNGKDESSGKVAKQQMEEDVHKQINEADPHKQIVEEKRDQLEGPKKI